jgi:hypothetical protein
MPDRYRANRRPRRPRTTRYGWLREPPLRSHRPIRIGQNEKRRLRSAPRCASRMVAGARDRLPHARLRRRTRPPHAADVTDRAPRCPALGCNARHDGGKVCRRMACAGRSRRSFPGVPPCWSQVGTRRLDQRPAAGSLAHLARFTPTFLRARRMRPHPLRATRRDICTTRTQRSWSGSRTARTGRVRGDPMDVGSRPCCHRRLPGGRHLDLTPSSARTRSRAPSARAAQRGL